MEQRNEDGRHDPSLLEIARNLKGYSTHGVALPSRRYGSALVSPDETGGQHPHPLLLQEQLLGNLADDQLCAIDDFGRVKVHANARQ